MIEYKGTYKNINYYIDDYQEDNKLLKGRKEGSGQELVIGNLKTINLIFDAFKKEQRLEKLKRILNEN